MGRRVRVLNVKTIEQINEEARDQITAASTPSYEHQEQHSETFHAQTRKTCSSISHHSHVCVHMGEFGRLRCLFGTESDTSLVQCLFYWVNECSLVLQ